MKKDLSKKQEKKMELRKQINRHASIVLRENTGGDYKCLA